MSKSCFCSPKFYEDKTDEELIEMIKEGDMGARDALSVRYWREKSVLVASIAPEAPEVLDDWDINEAYFVTYLNVEGSYEPSRSVKFLTYFCEVLRNEISAACAKVLLRRDVTLPVSMDTFEPIENDPMNLHEVVASGDVRLSANLEKEDIINLIRCHRRDLPKHALDIAILLDQGHTVSSASRVLGISMSSAKRTTAALREFLKKRIERMFRDDN